MRLIRNRPAHPSMSPTNPSTHRAEALRAAVPDPCAAAAQQHDPALGGRHEGLGEKCGLERFPINLHRILLRRSSSSIRRA